MLDSPLDLLLELPAFQYGGLPLDEVSPVLANLTDQVKSILFGGFSPYLVTVPRAALAPLAAFAQIEDAVTVPAGSWLVGFTGASPQAAGYRFSIFDVGRNEYVLTPQWMQNLSGAMDDTDTDRPMPNFLVRPYAIVNAGFAIPGKSGGAQ